MNQTEDLSNLSIGDLCLRLVAACDKVVADAAPTNDAHWPFAPAWQEDMAGGEVAPRECVAAGGEE